MFNIVIMGPPGSGKGTQSLKISEKLNLKHLSTGDLLREEIKSGSALGKEIADLIDKGNFVPDEMIMQMVEVILYEHKDKNGIIFDGFPRTVKQAAWLKHTLENKIGWKVNVLICLDVPSDELTARILNRSNYSGRADDADESIIANRIAVYHEKTKPVVEFYEVQGKLRTVNGCGTEVEVLDRLAEVIEKRKKESV